MIRHIVVFIALTMASKGAIISLQGTGTIVASGSFPVSAGQAVTLSIQYDDSTPSWELGGVGTVFNSPVWITLASVDSEWFGVNSAPTDLSVIFDIEAVETALIFTVPLIGSNFGTNTIGPIPQIIKFEISGFSPWFVGSQLSDLATADFTAAQTARFMLSGGSGSGSITADMDLSSFQVVPEPGTAVLVMMGAALLCRRKRGDRLG